MRLCGVSAEVSLHNSMHNFLAIFLTRGGGGGAISLTPVETSVCLRTWVSLRELVYNDFTSFGKRKEDEDEDSYQQSDICIPTLCINK